jgi:cell cycle serine/threonine-protein kinase CDC5/MSD2
MYLKIRTMKIIVYPVDNTISSEAKDLMNKLLSKDPAERPSLREVLTHEFFKKNKIPISLPLTFLTEPPST